jgi:serine/threonine-protein kinase
MTDPHDDEPDDEVLESLARALIEGTPVDWAAAEARAGDRAGLVRQMSILSEVATLHRSNLADAVSEASGAGDAASDQPLKWGHLTILERIGEGGFGEVFRARDRRLDREVALKLLNPGDAQADAQETIHEGRLLARVRHPNVLTVYGAEYVDGRVGVWTEFLHGRTLAQVVKAHGPFSPAEVIAIGIDLCRALAAVHEAGLLHLDIKAQNVMRTDDGRVVLLDFGAGHDVVARATIAPSDLRGTPLYLAPELWRKETPTPRSDIYSLGVLLYYLLTAAYPLEAASTEEIRDAQGAGRLRPLRLFAPDLPDALVRAVERALAHNPGARFESAAAFEQALSDVARPAGPTATGSTGLSPRLASVGVVLLVATLMGLGYLGRTSLTRNGSDAVRVGVSREKLPITCSGECRPSSDGRYIVRESANNITLWDMTTGKTRPVLASAGKGPERPAGGTAVLSSDNRTVAYAWRVAEGKYELRAADVESGDTRTVSAASSHQPWPNQWTQDGRHVLCLLERGDGRWAIAMIDVANGSERILASVSEVRPGYPSLSPDGRTATLDRVFSRQDWTILRCDCFGAGMLRNGPACRVPRYGVWSTEGGSHTGFESRLQ